MNTSGYGRVVSSALLASALKRLRQASGVQQKNVADALEWPISKLIRIENSAVRVSRTDLKALLRYYQADQERTDELIELARESQARGWWERFKIQNRPFETYIGYESGAMSIRMVQDLLIPGILQTEDYARLITGNYSSPEKIDILVMLRLERQEKVFARAPKQHYILDEASLRRRVGDVMPDQLRHLIELVQQPEITIQVVSFAAGPHFGMRTPFVLLGFDAPLGSVLFLERSELSDLIASEGEILPCEGFPGAGESAEQIAMYEDGFESLTRAALNPTESLALIERIASEMR